MSQRPPELIYAVDDRPPVATLLLLGLQHLIVLAGVGLAFPLVIARTIDLGPQETMQFLVLAMLASGLSTILQGLRGRYLGSGFLCPGAAGPAYIPATLLAAKTGGLSLVAGMTVLSGLMEMGFARSISKLRALFPPEVTGTVATMVGISLVPVATRAMFGVAEEGDSATMPEIMTGLATLAVFVFVGAWSRSHLRLYVPLIAIGIGYLVAAATGLFTQQHAQAIVDAPLLALPRIAPWGFGFDGDLLIPFLVAFIGSSLKTMGDITACQKINDLDWKRVDMQSASNGLFANGAATLGAGLLGAMGQHSYSANVGLSIATGATARVIAFVAGGLMIVCAFFPRVAMLFTMIPDPVIGALMVFAAAFMIVTGIQIVTSRMLDARKIFIVSLPMIFGLSFGFEPHLYRDLPQWAQPVFSSSLSVATILTVLLNLLLRIGVAKTVRLTLAEADRVSDRLFEFLETQGEAWGARKEVIHNAIACQTELSESIRRQGLAAGDITLVATFDEFNLFTRLSYEGPPIEIGRRRPTEDELLEDDDALERLATYIAASHASSIEAKQEGGRSVVIARFEH
ncbi:MAG: solute carrier family 23 protein [Chromatiales bacterium]|jgi:NCS2 family nucleobase:cation symporter-2|nr:solute carrier family 23 protein [Chromatiales bacterium]MDX9767932.1 solute carrier family 23 protein [Ectothiorhodospiraceae bacterium]